MYICVLAVLSFPNRFYAPDPWVDPTVVWGTRESLFGYVGAPIVEVKLGKLINLYLFGGFRVVMFSAISSHKTEEPS